MSNNRSHTALHSTSRVAGPAQRPGIHELGNTSPAPLATGTVVATGTVAAAVAVA